jgi:hypothetical protein
MAHLHSPRLTIALAVAVVGVGLLFFTPWFHLPGTDQGYAPEQPLAFSHAQHAGALGIDCQYCHAFAERSSHAGLPSADTCLNCHRYIPGTKDPSAIRRLYGYAGLDADGRSDPQGHPRPIPWVRVSRLPDYVRFDHSAHVLAGVSCQTCHGAVQTMERTRQALDLGMGACVNCHRTATRQGLNGKAVHAATDCSTCHQ